jgi:hypothetical protein
MKPFFITIKNTRINLNHIISYYGQTYNTRAEHMEPNLIYRITFSLVTNPEFCVNFSTEQERDNALILLDMWTDVMLRSID